MAFYKKSTEKIKAEYDGIVYILLFEIDGKQVQKIGVTQRKIEERVTEILTSFWKSYRYFPYCKPKRFKSTSMIFNKEAQLHYHFANVKYEPEHKTDGSSELFCVEDLDYLLDMYTRCIDGENIKDLEQYVPEEKSNYSKHDGEELSSRAVLARY